LNEEGALEKVYSQEVTYSIPQLTLFEAKEDPRYESKFLSIEQRFPIGDPIVFLSKKFYGSTGVVTSHTSKEESDSTLLCLKLTKVIEIQPNLFPKFQPGLDTETYIPLEDVARAVSISPLLFSRITGSFYVTDLTGERVNIGLGLKFSKHNQKVLGYTRRVEQGETGWEFSTKAVSLIRDFMAEFPFTIHSLEKIIYFDGGIPTYKEISQSHAEFQKLLQWRKKKKVDEYHS